MGSCLLLRINVVCSSVFLCNVCTQLNTDTALNRAFIYGDLLFETIKIEQGKPMLSSLHYTRLTSSACLLKFDMQLSFETFEQAIVDALNGQQTARVRFTLYRDSEGFYTPHTHKTAFTIEVFPLPDKKNEGITIGLYTDLYKSCHELSNLKTGNALIYVMAGIWAKENGFDDAMLLNEHGCICEATSSNIFLVKNDKVFTPALTEGCVDGVMRSHIISQLKQGEYDIKETVIAMEQLLDADHVFLTNAVQGIVPVKQFGSKIFTPFVIR
jgi:branched-chain amino acid aminotransferase